MSNRILWFGLGFILVALLACVPKTASLAPEAPGIAKAEWEARWEKTLEAARKEGRVAIFGGSGAAALKDAIEIIKRKFGFDLEITSARLAEITPKLLQERRAGLYTADIVLSGHDGLFTMKANGALERVEPWLMFPEVLDPKVWWGEKLPWADKEHTIFNIAYYPQVTAVVNTNMVQPGEIKSYYDLLDPKWKGKIVMGDPTMTDTTPNFWAPLYYKILGLQFFRQLVLQEPVISRDDKILLDWVAKGKCPIGLWPSTGRVANYIQAGAPIEKRIMKEFTLISAGGSAVALMNKAPHPNAAAIFINWLLSSEGSTFMQNSVQKHSARIDISTEGLDPTIMREPGVNYIGKPNEIEELAPDKGRYVEMAREIFSPLLK